jgi:membrane protein implicated in regulation of membrane protease activity
MLGIKLNIKEILEYSLNALIFGGLAAVAIGFGSWTISFLRRYEVTWEFELIFMGILLMIFTCLAARLLSKMN